MKVFISWSGTRSRRLAEIFRAWMPAVVQAAEPYFTPDDVAKGARWATEIARELESSTIGLLCLTAENMDAPWIMFEAGALSKSLDKGSVCPILFGVKPSDIKGPLLQFQAAPFERGDIRRVMGMINTQLGKGALQQTVFDRVFDRWWPELEAQVQGVLSETPHIVANPRSDRDVLEEVLALSRATRERLQDGLFSIAPMSLPRHLRHWPPLLRKAQENLLELWKEATEIGIGKSTFEQEFRAATGRLGMEHVRELQVSLIDDSRRFAYHDWPGMIGTHASFEDENGVDIFDDICRLPFGAVAWIDRTSNLQAGMGPMLRFSIALFTKLPESEWRIVVEAHEEL